MTWWLLLDGALGTLAGCITLLVIAVIRYSARFSVSTYRMAEPGADSEGDERKPEKVPVP